MRSGFMDIEELSNRARLLKVLSHPHRLCIVRGLKTHRCNVSKIQENLGLSQSVISQHLAKLRDCGIIKGVRNGKEICYEVIDPLAAQIAELVTADIEICNPK